MSPTRSRRTPLCQPSAGDRLRIVRVGRREAVDHRHRRGQTAGARRRLVPALPRSRTSPALPEELIRSMPNRLTGSTVAMPVRQVGPAARPRARRGPGTTAAQIGGRRLHGVRRPGLPAGVGVPQTAPIAAGGTAPPSRERRSRPDRPGAGRCTPTAAGSARVRDARATHQAAADQVVERVDPANGPSPLRSSSNDRASRRRSSGNRNRRRAGRTAGRPRPRAPPAVARTATPRRGSARRRNRRVLSAAPRAPGGR